MNPCPLCGVMTEGSRGRVTGAKYPICPECMAAEERLAEDRIRSQIRLNNMVYMAARGVSDAGKRAFGGF
mgnify:CR=1 FL=1